MLPLLRFAHTLVRAHPGPPADPLSPVVTRWRVWPNDLDMFGHMNNGRYQAIMDLARIDFLRRCDLFKPFVQHRWAAPVGAVHLEYRSALKPLSRYDLHTRLLWWDERWFYFRHEFYRADDALRPACTGYAKTLFRGRGGSVPTPDAIRVLARRELRRPPLPADLRAALQLAPS